MLLVVLFGCGRFDYDSVDHVNQSVLELSITQLGDGNGEVHSNPPGISCPPACDATFAPGTTVTLTATPSPENSFQAWEGASCVAPHACSVQMHDDRMIGAHFFGARNRIFVSQAKMKMSATAVADANTACQTEAEAAGLSGTFVAYLSTTTTSARQKLGTALGWVRPDGRPVSDDLNPATPFWSAPILRADQSRANRVDGSGEIIVTGSTPDGSIDANCTDFTTTVGNLKLGLSDAIQAFAISSSLNGSCAVSNNPFYCVQIDHAKTVEPIPQMGRRAFISDGFSPGNGIEDADLNCQNAADSEGLPGSYKALLAMSNATALSRFDLSGPPWVTPDGLSFYNSIDDLGKRFLSRSISTLANGDPVLYGSVYTGAPTFNELATTNCNDWSTNDSNIYTIGTLSFRMAGSSTQCTTNRIRCFQE